MSIACSHDCSKLCALCAQKKTYVVFDSNRGYVWGPTHESKANQLVDFSSSKRNETLKPICLALSHLFEEIARCKEQMVIAFDDKGLLVPTVSFSTENYPVVELHSNSNKYWYLNGCLHREEGPAIECVDGHKEWWVSGKPILVSTQEEYLKYWIDRAVFAEELNEYLNKDLDNTRKTISLLSKALEHLMLFKGVK